MNAPLPVAWLAEPVATIDEVARLRAEARQSALAKPLGALGRLEEVAVRLCGMQRTTHPSADRVHITVFAADHGVAIAGVSAYPQSVTSAMVRAFRQGGTAICVLARELGATFEVVNLGTLEEPVLGPGTRNFLIEPAMSETQLVDALEAGRDAAQRARENGSDLFIGGDMGIGNTTAASTLSAALLGLDGTDLAGAGTGLSEDGLGRKARTIDAALERHAGQLAEPVEVLRRLSGFEIAALTGSYIACATLGVPVVVDGFIATAAALAAVRINRGVRDWLLYSHRSAERGHVRLLQALDATPLLDLGMRLGEGTGAAVAVPILRFACGLQSRMATLEEIGAPGGESR